MSIAAGISKPVLRVPYSVSTFFNRAIIFSLSLHLTAKIRTITGKPSCRRASSRNCIYCCDLPLEWRGLRLLLGGSELSAMHIALTTGYQTPVCRSPLCLRRRNDPTKVQPLASVVSLHPPGLSRAQWPVRYDDTGRIRLHLGRVRWLSSSASLLTTPAARPSSRTRQRNPDKRDQPSSRDKQHSPDRRAQPTPRPRQHDLDTRGQLLRWQKVWEAEQAKLKQSAQDAVAAAQARTSADIGGMQLPLAKRLAETLPIEDVLDDLDDQEQLRSYPEVGDLVICRYASQCMLQQKHADDLVTRSRALSLPWSFVWSWAMSVYST